MSAQTAKNRASKVPAPTFVIRPARPETAIGCAALLPGMSWR